MESWSNANIGAVTPSTTLAQHRSNIVWTCRVCCKLQINHNDLEFFLHSDIAASINPYRMTDTKVGIIPVAKHHNSCANPICVILLMSEKTENEHIPAILTKMIASDCDTCLAKMKLGIRQMINIRFNDAREFTYAI